MSIILVFGPSQVQGRFLPLVFQNIVRFLGVFVPRGGDASGRNIGTLLHEDVAPGRYPIQHPSGVGQSCLIVFEPRS